MSRCVQDDASPVWLLWVKYVRKKIGVGRSAPSEPGDHAEEMGDTFPRPRFRESAVFHGFDMGFVYVSSWLPGVSQLFPPATMSTTSHVS